MKNLLCHVLLIGIIKCNPHSCTHAHGHEIERSSIQSFDDCNGFLLLLIITIIISTLFEQASCCVRDIHFEFRSLHSFLFFFLRHYAIHDCIEVAIMMMMMTMHFYPSPIDQINKIQMQIHAYTPDANCA